MDNKKNIANFVDKLSDFAYRVHVKTLFLKWKNFAKS